MGMHSRVEPPGARSQRRQPKQPRRGGAPWILEFAERGGELPSEAAVISAAETNEFEEAITAALVARGLVVDMQVGASRYRIDLAVRDPSGPSALCAWDRM